MFARMPAYTPVTRAPEPAYPQEPQYQEPQYQEPQQPQYAEQPYQGEAQQGYDYGQGYEGQGYDQQGYEQQPGYQNGAYPEQGYQQPAQGYDAAAYQEPAYQDQPLDLGTDNGAGTEAYPVEQSFEAYEGQQQPYDAQGYDQQAYAGQEYQPEQQAYNGEGYAAQDYAAQDYNGQPQQDYNAQAYAEQGYDPQQYNGQGYEGQGYEGQDYNGQDYNGDAYAGQDYAQPVNGEAAYSDGQYPGPQDPHRAVEPYEATYDHPPEIALGQPQPQQAAPQYAQGAEQVDADFLSDGEVAPAEVAEKPKRSLFAARNMAMVSAALVGAIALGGALAFVYKQTGGGLSDGAPPIIQAENSPVKEAPDAPGGKEFPHKNKLIYDRLENGDQPEADKLVPRQEELALPNMPAATDIPDFAAGAGGTPAPTEMAAAGADTGPRKVQTLAIRPDGTVDAAGANELQTAAAAATAPATTAAIPPAPAQAPAAAASKYVVQVASKQDQTSALAAFADMQQKYPSLLGNYRPMVNRVNLGSKGVWYRLQIGPMANQATASKLCSDLKAQGLSDCLVMAQ
ncbi:SPOR domain-containing protein [Methyloligella sp. 2.7D]|uniref:SPOR domain-containing protein n=1 Tax=unclassified Methyloligella TaxID=2625955 RepID=UPI00157D68A4|nr:SPOR domain-containing protein [Methyloligella sp. GL2]QKP77739.1 SPOR domain-containing protein [Methyloligella sp. GL2]